MSQDKLEEIARLLGGISDKIDVVIGSLTAEQRLNVKEDMEKIAKKRDEARARKAFRRPLMGQQDELKAVERLRRRWDGDGLASEPDELRNGGAGMVGGTTIVAGKL